VFLDSATEKTKESLSDASEYVQSSYVKTTDAASSTLDNVIDKSKGLIDNVTEKISNSEFLQQVGDVAENVGNKVIETGGVLANKAADISETVGAKVLESSDKTWDKISEVKESLAEKAKEVADAVGKKFDETVSKAETFLAEEEAKPKKEFADDTLNTGAPLLEGKDDFFAKASQYGDGNYDVFSEGKITVTNPDGVSSDKKAAPIAGQEDLDGDGNDLIDDAIIVEN
jgi:hypothetical protein